MYAFYKRMHDEWRKRARERAGRGDRSAQDCAKGEAFRVRGWDVILPGEGGREGGEGGF